MIGEKANHTVRMEGLFTPSLWVLAWQAGQDKKDFFNISVLFNHFKH